MPPPSPKEKIPKVGAREEYENTISQIRNVYSKSSISYSLGMRINIGKKKEKEKKKENSLRDVNLTSKKIWSLMPKTNDPIFF